MDHTFWSGKSVFITGHTGFKGAWLSFWLISVGARVTGYSVDIPTSLSAFQALKLSEKLTDIRADIRDYDRLKTAMDQARPEIVFHLAAQPLVIESYKTPVETYATNVMGTVNLLDAVRKTMSVKACIIVTSDKCYKNKEQNKGYIETDEMGGHDPYSSSKGCAELVTAAYRNSFFSEGCVDFSNALIASARAGNVIGGGDWAENRLIPDCITAFHENRAVEIRYPHATRPWQHVLEPLSGYIRLAEKLCMEGRAYSGAFNFGPEDKDCKTVGEIVGLIADAWGNNPETKILDVTKRHEAGLLMLNISKAKHELDWHPKWDVSFAVHQTVKWYQAFFCGDDMESMTQQQIKIYSDELLDTGEKR